MQATRSSSSSDLFNRARLARAELGAPAQASLDNFLRFCALLVEIKGDLERSIATLRDGSGSLLDIRQAAQFLDEVTAWHIDVQEYIAEHRQPAPREPARRELRSINVELMNTRLDSVHHLEFSCRCGRLLSRAQDVHRINLNCVWTRKVLDCRSGKSVWNPHKKEECLNLHCTHCSLLVGAHYPEKRLYKLYYVNMKGQANLFCIPAHPYATVEEAVKHHEPLDPAARSPHPRQGGQVKRDLERQRARDLGLREDDDNIIRTLSAQLRDATLRDAIGVKQQAEKVRMENQRLHEANRKLEQQVPT